MRDNFLDFLKVLDKMLKCPQMTLTEAEVELIKTFLEQVLDNNPNYGLQTKQAFKAMLDISNNPFELCAQLITYINSHDIRQ